MSLNNESLDSNGISFTNLLKAKSAMAEMNFGIYYEGCIIWGQFYVDGKPYNRHRINCGDGKDKYEETKCER